MAARRGVTDRHALLAAYGYGAPQSQQQGPSASALPSGYSAQQAGSYSPHAHGSASPYEQPYASTSSAAGPSRSPYHSKKNDGEGPAPSTSRSASSAWQWPGSGTAESRLAEQLEEGNDERLQGLSDRVKMLKHITMGIGNEVREGTADLSTLQDAMSNAGALLGNTFTKMNKMARRQGGWFWNMMLFLLFVCWLFVFLWWWRR